MLVLVGTGRPVVDDGRVSGVDEAHTVGVTRTGIVDAEALAREATQDLVERLVDAAREEVPERHVNGGEPAHLAGAGAGPQTESANHRPVPVELARVLAEEIRSHLIVHERRDLLGPV